MIMLTPCCDTLPTIDGINWYIFLGVQERFVAEGHRRKSVALARRR